MKLDIGKPDITRVVLCYFDNLPDKDESLLSNYYVPTNGNTLPNLYQFLLVC